MSIRIAASHSPSAGLADEIAALIRQLSSSAAPVDSNLLTEILASPTTTLLIARDSEGRAVGMLTLVVFRVPTGLRAIIEDVVVDVAARGAGVGAALTNEGIKLAQNKGARTIDLTSRPSQEAANRLYLRLGFGKRETNVYRLSI